MLEGAIMKIIKFENGSLFIDCKEIKNIKQSNKFKKDLNNLMKGISLIFFLFIININSVQSATLLQNFSVYDTLVTGLDAPNTAGTVFNATGNINVSVLSLYFSPTGGSSASTAYATLWSYNTTTGFPQTALLITPTITINTTDWQNFTNNTAVQLTKGTLYVVTARKVSTGNYRLYGSTQTITNYEATSTNDGSTWVMHDNLIAYQLWGNNITPIGLKNITITANDTQSNLAINNFNITINGTKQYLTNNGSITLEVNNNIGNISISSPYYNTTNFLNYDLTTGNITAQMNRTFLQQTFCWQQSANTSNLSGNDGGVSCGLNYTGNYNISGGYITITLYKPKNYLDIIFQGTYWQGGVIYYNITTFRNPYINNCKNYYNDKILFRIYGSGTQDISSLKYECYDGTWETMLNYGGYQYSHTGGVNCSMNFINNAFDGNYTTSTYYNGTGWCQVLAPSQNYNIETVESIFDMGFLWTVGERGNSCAYSSGNYSVNMSDYCIINTNLSVSGITTLIGNGNFTINKKLSTNGLQIIPKVYYTSSIYGFTYGINILKNATIEILK